MFKYETHLHTAPVSACAKCTVRETLEFYKKLEYDGVFITNHFIDGNMNRSMISGDASYREKIDFYFSDYEEGVRIGKKIGIKVFCGVEMSYKGTDFLVYGLDKKWFAKHPEIEKMKKSRELPYLIKNGALVIQAHPFREAEYIDHIRLFPRCVCGVEAINACRTDFENKMADLYAESYGLLKTAGSDNHIGSRIKTVAGMMSETSISSETEFITFVKNGEIKLFSGENPYAT